MHRSIKQQLLQKSALLNNRPEEAIGLEAAQLSAELNADIADNAIKAKRLLYESRS